MSLKEHELTDLLEKRFVEFAKKNGLKSSLNELDDAFFIKDFICANGFVSPHLGRQVSTRIAEILMNWNHHLHSLVMPNPSDMIQMNESKLLSDAEKRDILKLISSSMVFVSLNAMLTLSPDASEEARFIDDAYAFWKKSYKPALKTFIDKVYAGWKK